MPVHSNLIGGSTAARVIACPGSIALLAKMPEEVDKPSAYADEGTALHTCMEIILRENRSPASFIGTGVAVKSGNFIDITPDLVETCLVPAVAAIDILISDREVGLWLEERVEFPGVPDAFGTCDVIMEDDEFTTIVDFKFGAGVRVSAVYEDSTINPQLLFYACGARAKHPKVFAGKPIRLAIIQPRILDGISYTIVTHELLDLFEDTVRDAVARATMPGATIAKGGHCRFARCRTICPLHTGPMLDLALLGKALAKPKGNDYADVLAAGLDLVAMVEPLIKEFQAQAHAYLEEGGTIKGYKLVPKRATRRWVDEDLAPDQLRTLGLPVSVIYPEVVISPAQAEKALKTMGKALPAEIVAAVSSGTTLASENDARAEALSLDSAAQNFAAVLETLR